MEKPFELKDGQEAAHAHDGDWLQPTENPFGHGCCDCGLYHQVEYRIVNQNGVVIAPFAEGLLNIQLRFTRDQEETVRLREHQGK